MRTYTFISNVIVSHL